MIAGTRIHLPVLVVDDGSTDETAGRAEAAGATVLRQRPNRGKGAALRAGFRWAVDGGHAAVPDARPPTASTTRPRSPPSCTPGASFVLTW